MTTMRPPTFGDLLRRFRAATGLTQEELAARAGLSAKGIGDLERGARQHPRHETIRLIADGLGLAVRERAILETAARQRHGSDWTRADTPAACQPQGSVVPLVGRAAALEQIKEHLSGQDDSPLLLFAGEPGIGKSRLLREASECATQRGWAVLAAGCHRSSCHEPFAPFLDLLEHHLARTSAVERRLYLRDCAWLVRLLPELAEMLPPPPAYARGLRAREHRRLMFAAVARYLASVAGPAGTLLVLDDLQWAGPDALDLLAFLLRTASGQRQVRVVGAYRDTEVRAQGGLTMLLADLAREGQAVRTTLAPLTMEEAADLLEALLAGTTAVRGCAFRESEDTELRHCLLRRTAGIPFFLVRFAQELSSGALGGGGERCACLPWSVAEMIRQQVAVLPPLSRELLEIAAISGHRVPRGVLLTVATETGHNERQALIGLELACRARLLVETSATEYAFRHDLVRETIVADTSMARRAMLHQQIANAREQDPDSLPIQALAFTPSGDVDVARRLLD